MATLMEIAEIRIRGTVQGVGFRPAVWRLAQREGLAGEVLNDAHGVVIRTPADDDAVERFLSLLREEAPPLVTIEDLAVRRVPSARSFHGFSIAESVGGDNHTRVSPDAATCPACRAEIADPQDRRARYPFATCTQCGPRFSIALDVPFDRRRTTMAPFPMCADCAAEYQDPRDRRFHAQAIACAACGPRVWLEELNQGPAGPIQRDEAAVEAAAARLIAGQILAIRGLGGFHLACDATDAAAVGRLRQRKRRDAKPLALMARDVDEVRRHCQVSRVEEALLTSPEAPIVLLERRSGGGLPDALANGLSALGFMLPYTPLHQLILEGVGRPLVMTSANLSDDPQITGVEDARRELGALADAALMHDRDIASRVDDSVVRVVCGAPRMLRRARGYAPGAIPLPPGFEGAPDLLAFGGQLKSTFCLVKAGAAVLSQHQGDLERAATFDAYRQCLARYADLFDHRPALLVADRHPQYLSTQLATELAAERGLPLIQVQHHHAHLASCLADNGVPLEAGPVLGLAFDGLGLGDAGALWGGELILVDYRASRRLGCLKPIPMLGGAQAIREPWRSAYAHLVAAMGWEGFQRAFGRLELRRDLEARPLKMLDRMAERGLNAPLASSCGRLFDAVAAALGLCRERARFEGEGAMQLEALALGCLGREGPAVGAYPLDITPDPQSDLLQLDPTPLWWAISEDLLAGAAPDVIAARFHLGLAQAAARLAGELVGRLAGEGLGIDTVALSGGCFQNRPLTEHLVRELEAQGLRCLLQAAVPSNDGGLSLGQAAVAAAIHLGSACGLPGAAHL